MSHLLGMPFREHRGREENIWERVWVSPRYLPQMSMIFHWTISEHPAKASLISSHFEIPVVSHYMWPGKISPQQFTLHLIAVDYAMGIRLFLIMKLKKLLSDCSKFGIYLTYQLRVRFRETLFSFEEFLESWASGACCLKLWSFLLCFDSGFSHTDSSTDVESVNSMCINLRPTTAKVVETTVSNQAEVNASVLSWFRLCLQQRSVRHHLTAF